MIAFVRGEVAAVTLNSAVLEVGGVGLELMCTPGTLATLRVGRTAMLPTSMVVREDSLTVFGFLDDDEKQVFEIVADRLRRRPQGRPGDRRGDEPRRRTPRHHDRGRKALTRVPGIGQKGAQRIILELKDRIGPPVGVHHAAPRGPPSRRGATRCSRGWSGSAGRPRSPRRQSTRSRPTPGTCPMSAPCCGRPCAR